MSEAVEQPDLVADIGGTNARFGLARRGRVERIETLACAEHASLAEAARVYLGGVGGPRPARAALAIAGPVLGDHIEMTNHVWSFSVDSLSRELGIERLRVINDFAALALAVPALDGNDLLEIKPGAARRGAPIAVLGPGTGLGVAALVPARDTCIPITTEGGHRDLAATSEREWEIVRLLRERFQRASIERALSGPGLVNLYEAITRLAGEEPRALTPSAVVAGAREGSDPACGEALKLFAGWLGAVAGDLALTYGAHGGVVLGGGLLGRMGDLFDVGLFRRRFLDKGRMRDYLEQVPVHSVVHPHPALIGAARALYAERR